MPPALGAVFVNLLPAESLIMPGFAALLWLRGEVHSPPKRFPSEERRPWKRARQTLFLEKTHDQDLQRKSS
jgi:hypothetical protein